MQPISDPYSMVMLPNLNLNAIGLPLSKVVSHYTYYYTAYRESTGTSREGLDMDLSSAPCPLSALLRPVREK
jgi:hypothetical protein